MFEPPARFCARDGTPLADAEAPPSTPSPDLSEPPVPSLTLNQVIDDRYKVVRRLGEGGMSYVYQGRDQVENTDVAMKVLTPQLATDPCSMERLKREALLAMRFDHPNVCRIFHVGETSDGMLYLIMPYLRGESLNDAETRRGPYPVDEAVMLLVQACQGLQHAHDVGVIHRDLKPENIMLVPDDSVAGGIRARELRKRARRREAGLPEILESTLGALRQAGETRVLELLHTHRERDVYCASGDGIRRAAQRLGARSAQVLHARHWHVGQAQRHRQRQTGLRRALFLVEDTEPGRLDSIALHSGIVNRLGKGFQHQVVGAAVPALAETRAAHADDRHLVADAGCHRYLATVAFQK